MIYLAVAAFVWLALLSVFAWAVTVGEWKVGKR
jgi:hypothetical protein